MWPLERRRPVIRVGRNRAELWTPQRTQLIRTESRPLSFPDGTALVRAIESLQQARPEFKLDLVLETAWLPLMLLRPGREVWDRTAVEALARHRFGLLYQDPAEPVNGWSIRMDHRPGDSHGLAYGLRPSLLRALAAPGADGGTVWRSVQPAWSWLRGRARINAGSWLACVEQDRSILALLDGSRPTVLNAAMPPQVEDWRSAVRVEALRAGVSADGPLIVVSWEPSANSVTADVQHYSVGANPPSVLAGTT